MIQTEKYVGRTPEDYFNTVNFNYRTTMASVENDTMDRHVEELDVLQSIYGEELSANDGQRLNAMS